MVSEFVHVNTNRITSLYISSGTGTGPCISTGVTIMYIQWQFDLFIENTIYQDYIVIRIQRFYLSSIGSSVSYMVTYSHIILHKRFTDFFKRKDASHQDFVLIDLWTYPRHAACFFLMVDSILKYVSKRILLSNTTVL